MSFRLNRVIKGLKEVNIQQALYPLIYGLDERDTEYLDDLGIRLFERFKGLSLEPLAEPGSDILFFSSMKRRDYSKLLNAVKKSVENDFTCSRFIVADDKLKTGRSSEFCELTRLFVELRESFSDINNLRKELRYCLYLNYCIAVVYLIRIIDSAPRLVVFFADMQPIENLISQYLRKHTTIKTVTLQHGLYVDYEGFDTVNVVNYRHQPSEYFLGWGKNTIELVSPYHPNNTYINCGKPIYYQDAQIDTDINYITLVFDQPLFDEKNREMLDICLRYCRENFLLLNVKTHPNTELENFPELKSDIENDLPLEGSMFVVGHTTTMLVELMTMGVKTLIYKTEEKSLDFDDSIQFQTYQQLDNLARNNYDYDYKVISQEFISCNGGASKRRYKNAIKRILNGN